MSHLERLQGGVELHLDHYGGSRLPWACVGSRGIEQDFVCISGPSRGKRVTALDASGAYASACLGAGHPGLLDAVRDSMAQDGYVTDEVSASSRSELLLDLFGPEGIWTSQFPSGEYHVSGRNSGSEGMELALRLIQEYAFDYRRLRPRREWEKRRTLLCFEGAWHGWTGGVRHLLNRRHFRVGLPGSDSIEVRFLPFGEIESFRSFMEDKGGQLAAVFVEPVQGDAGILIPPDGYLREVACTAREAGALVVADEVLTFAKTGRFFAMNDAEGCIPTDITVIGKSLGMGLISQSMVIARRCLTSRASGAVATSDLRPLSCAIMHAGLRIIQRDRLLERSAVLGESLRTELDRRVVRAFPTVFTEVRGIGFLNGLQLAPKAAPRLSEIREHLLRHGIYLEAMAGAGQRSQGLPFIPPVLRLAPPLVADDNDLRAMVDRIEAAIGDVAEKVE